MLASPSGPHVILLGNHKGGSGKSTLAMHVAIALLKSGHQVTTIDLDYEQRTLTRYFENRRISAMTERHPLDLPDHHCVDDMRERGERWSDSDRIDALSEVLRNVHQSCDFILIDTPGGGSALNLFSHGLADTLITPVNDSFLDLDVIFSMGPTPETTLKPSRYAETVTRAFEARRAINQQEPDWIVVRNRISPLASRNERSSRPSGSSIGSSNLRCQPRSALVRRLGNSIPSGARRRGMGLISAAAGRAMIAKH